MKTFWKIVGVALLTGLNPGVFNAGATLEVATTVQISAKADFYAPLTPHGSWVEVSSYGRCWRPTGVAVEWRPYCEGYWVWTDCGWYWYSDEPWGWACYHYGYWVYDSAYGWVWVPDVVWGPAWVSWRVGGGYIGWAPLPPPGFSVHIAAPSLFVFVGAAHFTEPVRLKTVIVNNTTVIKQTEVINNMKKAERTINGSTQQKVMINEGPGIDPIQKATGKKIEPAPIGDAVRRTPVPDTLKQKSLPSTGHEERPMIEPQPAPGPKPERPPVAIPESQPPSMRPGQGNGIVPSPVQPLPGMPENPDGSPEGKGKGQGPGKGHGKDKP